MRLPPAIHRTAVIGEPPEHRDFDLDDSDQYGPEIAASARLSAFVTVDSGMLGPTRVGERTFLMAHVHIGHDAQVGDDCEIAPGAVVCGECGIGDGVKIGVNASILPRRVVGDGARIGAGAVVTRDIPPLETWAGNPARQIDRDLVSFSPR